jgi:hypothetical protein
MGNQPRFFYPAARAHHAFCMAKDFGMEYERRFGQKWEPEALLHISGANEYRIYVHADSLGLLEPRVGDYCVIDNERVERCGEAITYKEIGGNLRNVILMDGSYRLRTEVRRIIQRNGTAFHYPEVEQ